MSFVGPMRIFLDKLKFLRGKSTSKKVFVIGTGRSGTHWIGQTLESHPEIRATIEARPAFRRVTAMALNPLLRPKLYPELIRYYRWQHFRSVPRHYLDKSHPNIWLAEDLGSTFSDACFVGITRDPYATVSSMLRHPGVRAWHERWKEFPIPNDFLGITREIEPVYDSLPIAQKCALRWKAHTTRMTQLQRTLGTRILVVKYEALAMDTETVLQELGDFLKLKESIPVPPIRHGSLENWRERLSSAEIEQIRSVVGMES